MSDMARLRNEFDGNPSGSLAETGCRGLKCGKAATAPGCKLELKRRQGFTAEDRRKGLVKSVHRGNGDGAAGDSGVVEQKNEERRRQEWEIDRQKDCVAHEGGGKGRADSGQRTQIGMRIFDYGSEGFKRRALIRRRTCLLPRGRGPV